MSFKLEKSIETLLSNSTNLDVKISLFVISNLITKNMKNGVD